MRAECGNRKPVRKTPGDESHWIIQRYWDDHGRDFCAPERFSVGGVRLHGKHFSVHGSLCSTRWTTEPGIDSGRQDFMGQAFAVAGLWRAHLPVTHRL